MRTILTITFVAVTLSFGFSQISFAVCGGETPVFFCNTAPPNPDPTGIQEGDNPADLTITVLDGAEIDTIIANGGNGGTAIRYGSGSNEVTVRNAKISAETKGINALDNVGSATIHIENSTIFALTNDAIDLGNVRTNTLIISNSSLTSNGNFNRVLNSGQVDDTVNISGSTLNVDDTEVLTLRGGEDDVTLSNTILRQSGINFPSIALGDDNDTLTLFNGVVFERSEGGLELIDCGEGNDQIVFAMNVPQRFLTEAKASIAAATVPNGSITINGIFYDWTNCEQLVDDLQAGSVGVVRPIPTLSEWGLIAMASLIGLFGIIVVRRKNLLIRS